MEDEARHIRDSLTLVRIAGPVALPAGSEITINVSLPSENSIYFEAGTRGSTKRDAGDVGGVGVGVSLLGGIVLRVPVGVSRITKSKG